MKLAGITDIFAFLLALRLSLSQMYVKVALYFGNVNNDLPSIVF